MYRLVLEKGRLEHNSKLGVFTVIGTAGNPHAVKLFPKESCTCPSNSTCYHIIAAKISVGIESIECSKTINLSQL